MDFGKRYSPVKAVGNRGRPLHASKDQEKKQQLRHLKPE